MGHKHSREEILDGALAAALDDGLSQLTFGRLAKRLGISDRVIVYYFPTKDELVSEVITAMALRLQGRLATAFDRPAADHRELAAAAWSTLASGEADRVFALFFEANGLAAIGREPYASLVPALVATWIDWAKEFVHGSEGYARAEAEAAIALIDGLFLLRLLAGAEAADRAARTVGLA